MSTTSQGDTKEETLASKWGTLILFVGFSVLEACALVYGNLTFEKWKDWLIVFGAFMFPVLALVSAHSLTKDTRLQGINRKLAVYVKWVLAAPFALIAITLAMWLLFSIFGWFASIPGWAAVIIILLFLKR